MKAYGAGLLSSFGELQVEVKGQIQNQENEYKCISNYATFGLLTVYKSKEERLGACYHLSDICAEPAVMSIPTKVDRQGRGPAMFCTHILHPEQLAIMLSTWQVFGSNRRYKKRSQDCLNPKCMSTYLGRH